MIRTVSLVSQEHQAEALGIGTAWYLHSAVLSCWCVQKTVQQKFTIWHRWFLDFVQDKPGISNDTVILYWVWVPCGGQSKFDCNVGSRE